MNRAEGRLTLHDESVRLMMLQRPYVNLCLLVVWAWAGCANPVSWENDIHVPVLDDRVSWADVVPDSLYEPGIDGGPAHFVLVDTLDGWDWSDWTTLPDSTIVVVYDGEEELNNGLVVTEDMEVIAYTDEVSFSLPDAEGAELTDASLDGGTLALTVEHSLPSEVQMLYDLPGVSIDGVPLSIPMLLPPASPTEPGSATTLVDLTGAQFDFTGISGQETNALEVTIVATCGDIVDPAGFFIIDQSDSVVVSLGFEALSLRTLGGYFGSFTESATGDVALLDTVPLPNPVIDLQGATAALHFTNTVGADLMLNLDTLQFDESLVEGDLIAGHLIPRAVWNNGVPTPSEWTLDLASPGSNFLDLMETFPSSLHAAGRMTLNPNGDPQWLLDRWDVAYPPTFWYELRVPLKLGLEGVILRDTFDIQGLEDFPRFEGHLHLDFESSFPVEVTGMVQFHRNDGVLYSDTVLLPPGSVPLGTLGEGTLSIPLNADMALPGGSLELELLVNTYGPQPFTGYESVHVQGRLEGTQIVEVE